MRIHFLHAEIRREATSRVQRYFYPNMASMMSWKLHFQLSGTPPERGVNNIPRAMPRKLRFPIWGEQPSQALTAARGQHSLMYGIPPPHSMLEEDSCYPRNAFGTRTITNWLPNTWEYLLALLETSAPEDAHYVFTVRRTYRGDCDIPKA